MIWLRLIFFTCHLNIYYTRSITIQIFSTKHWPSALLKKPFCLDGRVSFVPRYRVVPAISTQHGCLTEIRSLLQDLDRCYKYFLEILHLLFLIEMFEFDAKLDHVTKDSIGNRNVPLKQYHLWFDIATHLYKHDSYKKMVIWGLFVSLFCISPTNKWFPGEGVPSPPGVALLKHQIQPKPLTGRVSRSSFEWHVQPLTLVKGLNFGGVLIFWFQESDMKKTN